MRLFKRRGIVAANWKMHGDKSHVESLLADILAGLRDGGEPGFEVLICPPSLYLAQARAKLADSSIQLGAQNVWKELEGAYTGEISARMVKDFDCRYVLAGHSERRDLFAESDELVAEKFAAIQGQDLRPILCVGESREQREADETERVVLRQMEAVVARNGVDALREAVIAYEPVWAIGTGLNASPEQAQAVHGTVRRYVAGHNREIAAGLRILYGGSVKAGNAAALFAQPDIDGALIGGASLEAQEFLGICEAMAAASGP